ncbi:Protein SMG7 [Mycena sanguinolenta]|uniref:Protein SMG7 n=1 Tax=Mycena sanguinolenta TaxID=230812 RepID=A0A8H6XR99_9AGAR|nr:Protein SMG7 [Mycena sanguinolenta]
MTSYSSSSRHGAALVACPSGLHSSPDAHVSFCPSLSSGRGGEEKRSTLSLFSMLSMQSVCDLLPHCWRELEMYWRITGRRIFSGKTNNPTSDPHCVVSAADICICSFSTRTRARRATRDAETYLWMQTSYTFIALYKQRLGVLSAGEDQRDGNRKQIETRKLPQRFRQYLADEDRFWRALVGWEQRASAVELPSHFLGNGNLPPELLAGGASGLNAGSVIAHGAGGGEGEEVEDVMNHFAFQVFRSSPLAARKIAKLQKECESANAP